MSFHLYRINGNLSPPLSVFRKAAIMIKHVNYLLLGYLILSPVQAETTQQKAKAPCRLTTHQANGNIAMSCQGLSPNIIKRLKKLLAKDGKDLAKAQKSIDHWLNKYSDLKKQLTTHSSTDPLAVTALPLLEKGNLRGITTLLKQSLAHHLAGEFQSDIEKRELDKASAQDAYSLGLIEELQWDHESARPYFEQAASLAPYHTLYTHEAGVINNTLSNFKQAVKYYKLALTNNLKILGQDHPNIAIDCNNLGLAWTSLGQHPKAIKYYELALANDVKNFGSNNTDVAVDRNNLGNAWKALGNHQKSVEYYELALASNLKNFGENHPSVGLGRNNLGFAWNSLKQYQKAIRYYELTLTNDLKDFGENHPHVAIDRNNLGNAWYSLGQYQKAINYYKLALASDLKIYGEDHPDVTLDRNNLGSAWKALGNYEKAIKYFKLSLASNVKVYGENHPDIAIDRNNLGNTWYLQGEYQKAIDSYLLALATSENSLGKNHPSIQSIRNNLSAAQKKMLKPYSPI